VFNSGMSPCIFRSVSALLLPLPTGGGNLAPEWHQPPVDVQWQIQLQDAINTLGMAAGDSF